ncbi:uncharacterized protein LOC107610132 [Arachis ipaensis]|uniref:uncharacterized protein LOC107610132 n=1 Tax=Arachis ipaensis TaxID=130454 RepID=UPI0007AF1357|nr:uncharacterized protein LOC107610132 [Arachis ipaensis]
MAAPRRVTLKEAGAPDFILQPLQVRHPELNANFELKTTLIHLLPMFYGLSAQDPVRHLRDFQGVCSTTRQEGSNEVAIWLFAFPFSLVGIAKEWFYTLPDEIVSDWNLLRRKFLDKFFPPEVTDRLRKEISCIVQGEMETLYEYWEWFRRLLDSCPHHMINTLVLISYICQGTKPQDKILLDASSNGSMTKYRIAEEAWQLITNLAESTRHARQRNHHPRAINEVSTTGETDALTKTLGEMTYILKQLQLNQQQLHLPKHNIVNNWSPKECVKFAFVTAITLMNAQTSKVITNMEETIIKEVISIKGGKITPTKDGETIIIKEEGTIVGTKDGTTTTTNKTDTNKILHTKTKTKEEPTKPTKHLIKRWGCLQEATPIPFPTLARKTKKRLELDPKMVEMFKKVKVTIPFFDAICQVPKYAKFLKDLCMNKEKLNNLETIPLGSSISALMDDIPEKCGDPGPCLVTCTIDGAQLVDCMCDLGACVSIMPLSVYEVLKLPSLKQSAARFVLVDKSIISVVGIAEDVLVSIKGLVFPIDFHILKMSPSDSGRTSSILLGRPFLKTSRFKLDAFSGSYSFEIDGIEVSFNLDEAIRHPPEDHSIFR